jgi:hypothetical protein
MTFMPPDAPVNSDKAALLEAASQTTAKVETWGQAFFMALSRAS